VCSAQATHNQQMKKKLEDVSRKLENMYSQIVTSKLSVPTLTGLHQIVQCIQQYDYQTALAYHSQLISTGSFTEISPFMPGIKVLLQVALQLQVYV
jgi:protein transport protein SEC31